MSSPTVTIPTYCEHCGYNLVGDYDRMMCMTSLRCPQTNEVKARIADRDRVNLSESLQLKLDRMMRG